MGVYEPVEEIAWGSRTEVLRALREAAGLPPVEDRELWGTWNAYQAGDEEFHGFELLTNVASPGWGIPIVWYLWWYPDSWKYE